MKTRVLDSRAILEWMNGREPAKTYVNALLRAGERGTNLLFVSAINEGEVYYFLHKTKGQNLSKTWRESCHTLPVTIDVPDIDDIWSAALLKGRFRIAYADAFAAALAQRLQCAMVTGDPEFQSIEELSLDWIRRRPK